jgi:hypothetical protein
MAVVKSTAAQNASCKAVVSLIDQGTLNTSGQLQLYRSTDSSVIVSMNCSSPCFQNPIDGTAMVNPITDTQATLDGTAATFGFLDCDGNFVWGGAVSSTGSGELNLSSTVISVGTFVSIVSGQYIAP